MLEQVLTSLSNGLSESLGWALLAAFAWGVVSIVFSPCHLASVPLVVGFISTQEDASTRRAFRLSLVFSLGVLASIALIGLITASLGRLVGDLGAVGNVAVAVVFFVFGLYLMDLLPLHWDVVSVDDAPPRHAGRARPGPRVRSRARPLLVRLPGAAADDRLRAGAAWTTRLPSGFSARSPSATAA